MSSKYQMKYVFDLPWSCPRVEPAELSKIAETSLRPDAPVALPRVKVGMKVNA